MGLKEFWKWMATDPKKAGKQPEPKPVPKVKEQPKTKPTPQTTPQPTKQPQTKAQIQENKESGFKKFWKFITTDPKKRAKENKQQIKPGTKIEPTTEFVTQPKLSHKLILFILINSILGSSLFFLPGQGVIASGAASIIAWIALFIIAIIVMLYIGELITLFPSSGGTYEYCKKAYGRFPSFIAGWLIWIAGNFGMALNIVAASEYFIPETTSAAFIMRIAFAALWIIVLNFMAFRGIDAGATMLFAFGVIATIVIFLMTLPSFIDFPSLFSGSLQSPFSLELMTPFFQHDGISILAYLGLSLLLISEAFFGFEVVTYMANEVKEPEKLHKTLMLSVLICGAIMLLYLLSSLGVVNYSDYVQNARPFAVQAFNTMGIFGQKAVVFGMYLVIIGAAAAWPITGSRLIHAMSRDKLFPEQFAVLHPKHNSPHRAVYFQTIMVAIFSWFIFRGYIVKWGNPYRTIYLIYVVLSMIIISLIIMSVPFLRKKYPDMKRVFKAPFATAGPIFIVLIFILLIYNWIRLEGGIATSTLFMSASFLMLGLPFYFLMEMFYNQKAIVGVNEKLAYFSALSEKISPSSVRKKIIEHIGNIKGKTVLEYGCSIGSLTKKLAPMVLPGGRIHAVDFSLTKAKMANKAVKDYKNIKIYHHPELSDFKVRLPKKADILISVAMLSYMQKPVKILKKMSQQLKPGAQIIFIDYDNFFHLIPNVKWIEDDNKLKEIFSKAGFNVTIHRKKSALWEYLVIQGKKN